jgi:hypothetical protein
MRRLLIDLARKVAHRFNADLVRYPAPAPPDFDAADRATIDAVRAYTSTSAERIVALRHAVQYVVANGIPGDFVECGVWKGGSMMAAARTLLEMGDTSRDLYLYDTFEGMTAPTMRDVSYGGESAAAVWKDRRGEDGTSTWSNISLDTVREAMESVGYDQARIHLVKGPVEQTIPEQAPSQIALLRLDTDWYESTYHELEHLFPRLVVGGVLIIDDYGHWLGAREATDEYIRKHGVRLLLNRIDYTGRIAVKT